jgi:hypothetical protein
LPNAAIELANETCMPLSQHGRIASRGRSVFVAFMVICVRNTCRAGRGTSPKRMTSF